jgi:TPR repeat
MKLQKLHDYPGAIADYDKAIDLSPKDKWAYLGCGITKNRNKDYNGAI